MIDSADCHAGWLGEVPKVQTGDIKMTEPTFSPGQPVWHVRHGKVTLGTGEPGYPVSSCTEEGSESYTTGGRLLLSDVGRILYTLEEAAQYGWLPQEPLVVEFETTVEHYGLDYGTIDHPLLQQFGRKRVHVTIREVGE